MAIWNIIDLKYLPPFIPRWKYLFDDPNHVCHRTADQDAIKEIWKLYDGDTLSKTDKIVLGTTFDNVVVLKKDMLMVIEAFNNFEGNHSLKEQALILEQIYKSKKYIGCAWNQTSVNGDAWIYGYTPLSDKQIPYNIKKHTGHYEIFNED